MRTYELVVIFDGTLQNDVVEGRVKELEDRLKKDGGEIIDATDWGKRHLAYPIKKRDYGYYSIFLFKSEPAVLPELDRVLKLDETVIRHLLVLSEGER